MKRDNIYSNDEYDYDQGNYNFSDGEFEWVERVERDAKREAKRERKIKDKKRNKRNKRNFDN